jgi:hypothetical protein
MFSSEGCSTEEAKKHRAGKAAKVRVSRLAFAPVEMKPEEIRQVRVRLGF